MTVTAQGAIRRVGDETVELARRCRAVTEDPGAEAALAAFLAALAELDPGAARPGSLSAALAAVLSLPRGDLWAAEIFAQQSLRAEISAMIADEDAAVSLPPATVALIIAFLQNRRICCLFLEGILTGLRRSLLMQAQTGQRVGTDGIRLAEAMARHSFLTEYIWDSTAEEEAGVRDLEQKISAEIESGAAVSAFELFLVGAYRPLHTIDAVRRWVRGLDRQDREALDPALAHLVLDRLVEEETRIEAITPISAPVSQQVQAQYEENPYPRWRHLPPTPAFRDTQAYFMASLGLRKPLSSVAVPRPRVLVAGAGTGAHPISLAQSLPGAAILALDLSRASLAYATREAAARGIGTVAFAQGDILKLSGVDAAFDLVESVGVLHHMEDPEAGLQALTATLKPGGYLRLALYSRHARPAVNAARARFAEAGGAEGQTGIRAFRRDLAETEDPALVPLRGIRDFFAASEFRDLVMHVQEHQFTIPEIGVMLKRNGLKFLGFCSPTARAVLAEMPPKMADRKRRDLESWDRYERRYPDTFLRMYDFFCMKR